MFLRLDKLSVKKIWERAFGALYMFNLKIEVGEECLPPRKFGLSWLFDVFS